MYGEATPTGACPYICVGSIKWAKNGPNQKTHVIQQHAGASNDFFTKWNRFEHDIKMLGVLLVCWCAAWSPPGRQ